MFRNGCYQFDPTPGRHVKGGAGAVQMLGANVGDKYNYTDTGAYDVQATANCEVMNASSLC